MISEEMLLLFLLCFSMILNFCLERLLPTYENVPPWKFSDLSVSRVMYGLMVYTATPLLMVCYAEALRRTSFPVLPQAAYLEQIPDPTLRAAAEAVLYFLAFDIFFYLHHRFFLHGPLWKVHKVHHIDTKPDWLTAVKMHPIEWGIMVFLRVLALLVVPVRSETAVFAIAIVDSFYLMLGHGSLNLKAGPLQKIFVTPQSHRLHHRSESAFYNKNFAFYFSFFDLFGGTYIPPHNARPGTYGLQGEEGSFLTETLAPFRAKKTP
jgi:sterol desaturase/sphingolipid hydroxylase (fatty acid hydroxylase superfamily)